MPPKGKNRRDGLSVAVDLAERLGRDIQTALTANQQRRPAYSNYASMIGHPCLRYLVYFRTEWESKELPSPYLEAIFRDGRIHEDDMSRLLMEASMHSGLDEGGVWKFVGQQQYFRDEDRNISGSLDGFILFRSDDGEVYRFPTEVKSVSPFIYDRIQTLDDFFDDRRPWLRKWPYQLMTYMLLAEEEEVGFLILKCKSGGKGGPHKVIPVPMDYDRGEEILSRAETIESSVARYKRAKSDEARERALPDRIPADESVCGRCDFLHLCRGEREWGPQLLILEDEDLVPKLKRRDELDAERQEFGHLDDVVKVVAKNRAVDDKGNPIDANLVVGPYLLKVKVIRPKGKDPYQKVDIGLVVDEEVKDA